MTKFLVLENFVDEPRWKAPVDVKVIHAYNENGIKILKRIFRHNVLTIPFCLDRNFVKSFRDYDIIIIPDTIATDAFNKWIAARKREDQRLVIIYANRFRLVHNFSAELAKTLGLELWSYSREDCEAHALKHYNQFQNRDYITNFIEESAVGFDAIFVANAKDRLAQILMLQKLFKTQNVNAWFFVTKTDELPDNNCKDGRELPYTEYLKLINKTKCLVDIVSSTNAGITNRPIEALFFKKKLITNYIGIMRESFYNHDNIFIVGHDDDNKLNDFVNSAYTEIDDAIIKQYDSENFYKILKYKDLEQSQ